MTYALPLNQTRQRKLAVLKSMLERTTNPLAKRQLTTLISYLAAAPRSMVLFSSKEALEQLALQVRESPRSVYLHSRNEFEGTTPKVNVSTFAYDVNRDLLAAIEGATLADSAIRFAPGALSSPTPGDFSLQGKGQ